MNRRPSLHPRIRGYRRGDRQAIGLRRQAFAIRTPFDLRHAAPRNRWDGGLSPQSIGLILRLEVSHGDDPQRTVAA